ncbi:MULTISPECIES: DUF4255 domain-containing protein [Georgenia]|uniref:DUF4255 domain-containing protein n=1 Tax=Georgenia TaxID=154116 RepID=UPI00143D926A|nr:MULTISPECIES: DUF4255 domain-containing protein [Georgenia]
MLIPTVEDGLEALLRATLPLPEEVGDVSFEAPSGAWSAQVNRVTVNLFLYAVARSPLPPLPPAARSGPGGTERRPSLPLVQLSYLVSAWAGSTRDEHQLLGDVLTRFLSHQTVPAAHLPATLTSSVQLSLASDEVNRPRELWAALGSNHRAAFTLVVTMASDAFGWQPAATGVSSVEGLAAPVPHRPATARDAAAEAAGPVRRSGGGLVRSALTEGRS